VTFHATPEQYEQRCPALLVLVGAAGLITRNATTSVRAAARGPAAGLLLTDVMSVRLTRRLLLRADLPFVVALLTATVLWVPDAHRAVERARAAGDHTGRPGAAPNE
jgi:hypothetical protein